MVMEVVRMQNQDLDNELKAAIDIYNQEYEHLKSSGEALFHERQQAVIVIDKVEKLINSIARSPKEFETEISEIRFHRETFMTACDFAQKELQSAKKSLVGAGAGVTSGIAVASFAPSAAMWIATTFGTASTGTAISALSGAAATKAALAWLGGGALSSGGGGMAAGSAFLAMAGPIGWGIGGATLLTSIVLFATKKNRLNWKKTKVMRAVIKNTGKVKNITVKLQCLSKETQELHNKLIRQYQLLKKYCGKDFLKISESGQYQLATLVNNTKALAAKLSEKVDG